MSPNKENDLPYGKLAKPESYFRGLTTLTYEIPNNIVCFSRTFFNQLGKEHHYHHRYVLLIVGSGTGHMVLDGRNLVVKPKQALLIFPYQFHHFLPETKKDLQWLFITFELNHGEGFAPLKDKVFTLDADVWQWVGTFTDAYLREPTKKNREATTPGPYWLGVLLSQLSGLKGKEVQKPANVAPTKLDRIKKYIWDHKHRDITIKELAGQFSLSESYLRQIFRKSMGMSIGAYIVKVRLNLAQSLLLNSTLNVSEIAYKCGYDSIYSFSRAFKNRTGYSPLKYRKMAPLAFKKRKD